MISINDVYQTTLTLLNKEQRGYVTPEEFNQIAGLVQNEVFEGYFQKSAVPENLDSELANIGDQYRQKLEPFITQATVQWIPDSVSSPLEIDDFYRHLGFYPNYPDQAIPIMADNINFMEYNKVLLSPLTSPTKYNPVVIMQGEEPGAINPSTTYDSMRISPEPTSVLVQYIRTPNAPNWVGTTLNGQLIPNASDQNYQDFELHESDYMEVVPRVLSYFGLQTRSDEVIGVAGQKEAQNSAI